MTQKQPRKTSPHRPFWKNSVTLGFVAGLITGLAIAIMIAMIITRSPVPFNSKFSKQDKSSSSKAANPFQDPNQPMYGNRDTAKDAYKNAATEPGADTGKETGPDAAEKEKPAIYLQTGAYREKSEAENMRAKLALLGIEAQITEAKNQSGSLHRVRLGPYTQNDLTAIQNKLKENGIEFTVSRPRQPAGKSP